MKRVAIITSSDTGYRGEREDLSGPAIREIVEKNGYEVVSEDVLPDDASEKDFGNRHLYSLCHFMLGGGD